MTHSLKMVNTSNWDGENFLVTTPRGTAVLRPGQAVDVSHGEDVTVEVKNVDRKNPPTEPFYVKAGDKDIGQTWPIMHVEWEADRARRPVHLKPPKAQGGRGAREADDRRRGCRLYGPAHFGRRRRGRPRRVGRSRLLVTTLFRGI